MNAKTLTKLPPPHLDKCLANRPGEVWKDFINLEGYVEISNHGRLKRLARSIIQSNGIHKALPERIFAQSVIKAANKTHNDNTFQLVCHFMIEGNLYQFSVRKMMYYHFVKEFDLTDHMINIIPKNGNGLDVNPKNLKKVTIGEKVRRSVTTGRMVNTFAHVDLSVAVYRSVLTTSKEVSQYDVSGKLIQIFTSIHEAGRCTGISSNAISDVANGRGNTAGGYYWRHGRSGSIDLNTFHYKRKQNYRRVKGTKVTQYDLAGNPIARYNSLQEAAEVSGCIWTSISATIRGVYKTGGGYIWRKGHHFDRLNLIP
ncbi:NUMOD1 domain-containing DNA-binding protein [Chitinophaga cymbidii]|uniref:Nuclease-associated modular DNA-binding 1 domain-containing protein n=1 Tax=Chitinophaga cymbidii TaxID=1096750 RepID=A0A512RFQ5_9BACT|nr:NUMOD1 domain-containing DNA-binding protein [Chitinophaga cymbidii]GEP94525.1 hypothetical protein CCY01nite_07850 [Chitinophaga cymbidii]